jgi:hypothetical protein
LTRPAPLLLEHNPACAGEPVTNSFGRVNPIAHELRNIKSKHVMMYKAGLAERLIADMPLDTARVTKVAS